MTLATLRVALQGLFPLSPIAAASQGLIGVPDQLPPINGPSGGVSWLRGYVPKFDYLPRQPHRRRSRRNEILFLAPKV